MILQFKVIKNVGRFRSFSSSGSQYDLKKQTVLFGKNTHGKSTLTAIAKSLGANNPDYLIGRKTFGSEGVQEVVVAEQNGPSSAALHRFDGVKWNSNLQTIHVFDSKYVRENIHTEEAVLDTHQLKLESVILGQRGRELYEQLAEAEKASKENSEQKTQLTREYNTHQRSILGLDFADFLAIVPDHAIDQKIEAKQKDIESYKKYSDIKRTLESLLNLANGWDFTNLAKSLAATLKVDQGHIQAHISKNLSRKGSALVFLNEGYGQLVNPKGACVFCGQSIAAQSAQELIGEFAKLFSQAYKDLQKAVKDAEAEVNALDIRGVLLPKIERLQDLGVNIQVAEVVASVETSKQQLLEEIHRKRDDLSCVFDDAKITALHESVAILSGIIEAALVEYEEDFDQGKLDALQAEQRGLNIVRTRSMAPWVEKCTEYAELGTRTKKLTAERNAALRAKNQYAETVFETYGSEINAVLSELNARFKLVDLKPRATIRSKQPLYALEFDGEYKVEIGVSEDSRSSFSNSLSESDKRLLGFAFYIAEVRMDFDKSNSILFVDDPMSSFDTERKVATAKLLRNIAAEVEQIIVLTHEEHFLKVLSQQFTDCVCHKIGATKDNASIQPMDLNDEYLDAHYRQLCTLKILAEHESAITADDLRCMRDVIENIMMRKYYLLLQEDCKQGKSVGAFIDTLMKEGVYTEDIAREINELYLHFWNHDDSAKVTRRDDFSEGDLRNIATDFLRVIHKV